MIPSIIDRIAHPGHAARGPNIRRDPLEGHDRARAGILGDPCVLGCYDVHDDAAFEHLGKALLGGPGGGLGGHAVCSSFIGWSGACFRGTMAGLASGLYAGSSEVPPAATRALRPTPGCVEHRARRWARAAGRGRVSGMEPGTIAELASEVVSCRRCARLVAWREEAAAHPPARFSGERYWARPLPGFGDPRARILLVGLAPAAHGGNRTGRLFTGDRSGDFLFASLHRTGFANLPASVAVDDGLVLHDVYVAAVVRCAPPDNKPAPDERAACLPFLVGELRLLHDLRVVVALGAFAWDGAIRALGDFGYAVSPKPEFRHLAEARIGPFTLLGSYHPSQQNTFTGRLTPAMLDEVMVLAGERAGRR